MNAIKLNNRIKFNITMSLILTMTISGVKAQGEPNYNESRKTMPAQLTFITPLGTNGLQSGQMINNLSINILAGISGGVNGAELGGIVNISKGEVIGFQAAGLFNGVISSTDGVQMAGLANYNKGTMKGVQTAGLANLTTSQFDGIQMAGLINTNTYGTHGVQAAGLVNTVTGSMDGLQMSGIANVTTGIFRGLQLGLVNYTRILNGFQIGLINVADSVGAGAGLGLLTFYRNGYHALEIGYNETFPANVTFKSGVEKFYMVYTLGFKTRNDKAYWAPGIGLGSYFHISENTGLNLDLISQQVNEDEWWTDDLNMLNTLKLSMAVGLSDKIEFLLGTSFNVVVSGIENDEGNVIGDSFSPWAFYKKTYSQNQVKMYFGFNTGLRF